jgi:hypothetical protein
LLTDLSGVGVAGHIGTGGTAALTPTSPVDVKAVASGPNAPRR